MLETVTVGKDQPRHPVEVVQVVAQRCQHDTAAGIVGHQRDIGKIQHLKQFEDSSAGRLHANIHARTNRLTLRAEWPGRHNAAVRSRQPRCHVVPQRSGYIEAVDENQRRPRSHVVVFDFDVVDYDGVSHGGPSHSLSWYGS